MSYTINVSKQNAKRLNKHGFLSSLTVEGLQEARTAAEELINEAADGFSDDRDALKRYGYTAAQDWAMDVPEEGGECTLADGTTIEVVNNDLNKEDE